MTTLMTQAKGLATKISKLVSAKQKLDLLGASQGKPSEDFLYEVFVDMRILFEINKNKSWHIEFSNGTANKIRLPRKPANKSNFPYFSIQDGQGNELFQVCFGTFYRAVGSKQKFAPDVSVQVSGAPPNPDASHVVFCIDQKYSKSPSSSLDRDEVFALAGKLNLLFRPTGTVTGVTFKQGLVGGKNQVVTNSKASTLDPNCLNTLQIREISGFEPGKKGTSRG